MTIQFHGTVNECVDLTTAVDHNCTCAKDSEGTVLNLCTLHKTVLSDQRYLDGLLAMRHMRSALQAEEDVPFVSESYERLAPYRGQNNYDCPCGCGRTRSAS